MSTASRQSGQAGASRLRFVRFPTAACSRCQRQCVFQVGVPSWVVDIRHAATHHELPDIEQLRPAAHFAVNWLKVPLVQATLEFLCSQRSPPTAGIFRITVSYPD